VLGGRPRCSEYLDAATSAPSTVIRTQGSSWPEGRKDDQGKLRYDLLPAEALEEVVRVFTSGAARYGDRNWEKGITYGRVFGAVIRHMWAWWKGEGSDRDSGLPHLAHAAVDVLFLLHYSLHKKYLKFDNRPSRIITPRREEFGQPTLDAATMVAQERDELADVREVRS
jgi:hypothetical protein